MELRHLRYFVKVASELHFGRAADALGISQPPLSQQIRLLEQELGVQLFERSSRKVRLTTAGRLFVDEAKATLAQADHAIAAARRAASGEIGELTIGLSPSTLFVPAVSKTIGAFRSTYPDIHFQLTEQSTALQREAVDGGTLDLGFVRSRQMPVLPEGVFAERVSTDRMIVAMHREHALADSDAPIAVAALADEPMVHYPYDREGFLDDLLTLFEEAGLRPRMVQEINEMSTLIGLVAAGLGISVLTGSLQHLAAQTVHFRELSDANAVSSMWMLHRGERASPAAIRFADMLRESSASAEEPADRAGFSAGSAVPRASADGRP